MTYTITQYTRDQARKHNVDVYPSTRPNKKIDVYWKGQYLASVGDSRYRDYPTWWAERGKAYADERRRLYKIRHNSDRHEIGTAGWFADKLLW